MQGFVLSILASFGLLGGNGLATYKTTALATSIQDAIICFECLPAALMFAVAFPARDYMRPGEQPGTLFGNIVDMFDVRDLGRDVGGLVEDRVRLPVPPALATEHIADMFDVRDLGRDVGGLVEDRVRLPFPPALATEHVADMFGARSPAVDGVFLSKQQDTRPPD